MSLKELKGELDRLIELKDQSIDWDDEELDDLLDDAVTQLLGKMKRPEV